MVMSELLWMCRQLLKKETPYACNLGKRPSNLSLLQELFRAIMTSSVLSSALLRSCFVALSIRMWGME